MLSSRLRLFVSLGKDTFFPFLTLFPWTAFLINQPCAVWPVPPHPDWSPVRPLLLQVVCATLSASPAPTGPTWTPGGTLQPAGMSETYEIWKQVPNHPVIHDGTQVRTCFCMYRMQINHVRLGMVLKCWDNFEAAGLTLKTHYYRASCASC